MQWPLYFFLTRPQASKNGFLIRYEDRIFSIFKAQGFSGNMNNEGYKYFFCRPRYIEQDKNISS